MEKEADLALQASGRNDGEVHPGIDLSTGSLKHHYIRRGNEHMETVCRELGVPFHRVGQYVCFEKASLKPMIAMYCRIRKNRDGISDTELISGEELSRREPNLHFAPTGSPSPMPKMPCRTAPGSPSIPRCWAWN